MMRPEEVLVCRIFEQAIEDYKDLKDKKIEREKDNSSCYSIKDIEKFFGIRATVKLWVKVKEDWRNRQGLIHTFGLD